MNCIIISPDTGSRKQIEKVINDYPLLNLLSRHATVQSAAEALLNNDVDLAFIEIAEPVMAGEIRDTFRPGKPLKVFLSSQKELAKDAYDLDGNAFILLPMTTLNLTRAIGKVTQSDSSILANPASKEFIFVKNSHAIFKVAVKDILYIQALADYVNIYTATKRYTVHSTMHGILKKLPMHDFIRVHKSYIVRLESIHKIEAKSLEIGHVTVPLSRTYRQDLLENIEFL